MRAPAFAELGLVGEDGLGELAADRVERIERGQRVLEDHADAPAAHPAHVLGPQIVDALAVEQDLAAREAAGRLESPMIAAPVSDLPAPDSPTTPRTSPLITSKETSSIATSVPRRVGNSTRRLLT